MSTIIKPDRTALVATDYTDKNNDIDGTDKLYLII